jgi:hypothetical protein
MPRIELSSTTSLAVIIMLGIVAAAIAYFFYRYTLPPVPRATRFLLTVLRTAALFLLCLLLFEPLARLLFSSTRPPILAVLIDDSRSMRLIDRLGDRAKELRTILRGDLSRFLPPGGALQAYTFGSQWKPRDLSTKDSLRLDEEATDISAALSSLAREREQHNIQAAVLLTDGNYNLGQSPLYDADGLGMPVYTVGIGDTSEQKDLLITRIATNDIVFSETPTPVNVTVKSTGFGGQRVEVILSEAGRELSRTSLKLEPGTHEYQASLTYSPTGTGGKKYTVFVSSLSGELTRENNRKSFSVRILKSKLRVVMIAGAPSADVSMIRQLLTEENNLAVACFTQRRPSGFYEGQLPPRLVDSADCLLLLDFPTHTTSPATLELIRVQLVDRSLPVFFIDGKNVDRERLGALLPVLPFTVLAASSQEQLVSVRPPDAQRSNPIINIFGSRGTNLWSRLPPLFRTTTTYRAKAEATVLAYAEVQNVPLADPILLTRSVNRQRSLALLAYGLWRWRLMTTGDSEAELALPTFLANSIRWLTTEEERRLVRVRTSKDAYTLGEPIEFLGQVYDASAQPVDDAHTRVIIRRGERTSETILRPVGNGRYEGAVDGLGEGEYTFNATAHIDNLSLGEDRGTFSVGGLNLEFEETRMNSTLLRQLAYRTGGKYFTPGSLADLMPTLRSQASFIPRQVIRTQELDLWNWQYMLATIVLLLGLEWFLRKRNGML